VLLFRGKDYIEKRKLCIAENKFINWMWQLTLRRLQFFFHVSCYDTAKLSHVAGLETHIVGAVFCCSITFDNVYIGYTHFYIYFVWLNFIWDFKLLEFEVGGYDNLENVLKTILKVTINTSSMSRNYVF
jgi:hypothetical protein